MAFPDDVASVQAGNTANVTSKTLANSISPGDVGGVSDQICNLLLELYGLLGTSANLQAVTTLGNSTTEGMYVGIGSMHIAITGCKMLGDSIAWYEGGAYQGQIQGGGGTVVYFSKDPNGSKQAAISAGVLTQNRYIFMPDEGATTDFATPILDYQVVLHTTANPITVGTVTDGVVHDKNKLLLYKSGLLVAAIDVSGSAPVLKLVDPASSGYATIKAGALTGNHTYSTPDKDGTFAMLSDIQDLLTPTGVKTANYNAAAGDFVPVDVSGGAVTIALPATPADKTTIGVKLVKASTASVTVAASASDVFNVAGGPASQVFSSLNQSIIVQYAAGPAIWYIMTADNGITPTSTTILKNKRNVSRVQTTTSTATLSVNADSYDAAVVTAQAANIRINNPTGTPNDMDMLAYRIKDDGTSRTITWGTVSVASLFRDGSTVSLPAATVVSKTLYVVFSWNALDSIWDLISVNQL